ncbi:MAG TPA: putative sulfate exporter family transporter [Candidatus Polarisedimenticolaceae bacterium]|nr:putative sulfate exporter family transporter [Candidatus Polarisedimenticolaceae bacterium]
MANRPALNVLPGLLLALGVAIVARWLHGLLPGSLAKLLGEVIVAVVLGLAVANVLRLPAIVQPGLRFAFNTVLRTAIVLLGAGLSFRHVAAIGGRAVGMIAVLMALALAVAHLLARSAGVPGKLATLIGVGTAVCGNSAISATAPVIGAKDEETAFAIATNTLFGTLAVFAYPLLGHALHLDAAAFGSWCGTAVNDTSQVVATGFAYGDAAGKIATVVKLTRNALMGPLIVLLGVLYGAGGRGSLGKRLKASIPLFVLGFLAMALLNTLGAVAWASSLVGRDLGAGLQAIARFLILLALAGVGLGTRFEAMRRIGARPFYVGLATALAVSAASLTLITLFGPAGR